MTLNENEIERLAGAIASLRPDWPAASLRTFIANHHADRTYRDAAVAYAWIATTTTETPRLVLEAGPWWRATREPGHYFPPKGETACRLHPGEWRDRCRICAVDKIPSRWDDDAPPTGGPLDVHAALAERRAELRCSVCQRPHCREHPKEDQCSETDGSAGAGTP